VCDIECVEGMNNTTMTTNKRLRKLTVWSGHTSLTRDRRGDNVVSVNSLGEVIGRIAEDVRAELTRLADEVEIAVAAGLGDASSQQKSSWLEVSYDAVTHEASAIRKAAKLPDGAIMMVALHPVTDAAIRARLAQIS
jgi:hypothetical protein